MAKQKRSIFVPHQKVSREDADLSSKRTEFQSSGATEEKALSLIAINQGLNHICAYDELWFSGF